MGERDSSHRGISEKELERFLLGNGNRFHLSSSLLSLPHSHSIKSKKKLGNPVGKSENRLKEMESPGPEERQKEKKLKRTHTPVSNGISQSLSLEDMKQLLVAVENGDRIATRRVKNYVIGSQAQKRKWLQLGAAPSMVKALSHWECTSEAAAALGALARGPGGAHAVMKANGASGLCQLLIVQSDSSAPPDHSPRVATQVTEAALRSLRALAETIDKEEKEMKEELAKAAEPILPALLWWISQPVNPLAALAAETLAAAMTPSLAEQVSAAGGVTAALSLLRSSPPIFSPSPVSPPPPPAARRAAMRLGAALSTAEVAAMATSDDDVRVTVMTALKGSPLERLRAAEWVVAWQRHGIAKTAEIERVVRQTAPLLSNTDESHVTKVAQLWSNLLEGQVTAQRFVLDVVRWEPLVERLTDATSPKVLTALLLIFAATAELCEKARLTLVEVGVVGKLVSLWEHPFVSVRGAAAETMRRLSRSVRVLRETLTPTVVPALLRLAEEETTAVAVPAVGVLGNAALDFSPLRHRLQERRVAHLLVRQSRSQDLPLRRIALAALKNYLYMADQATKEEVMNELTWEELWERLRATDTAEQLAAAQLLRNLADADGEWLWRVAPTELIPALASLLRSSRSQLRHEGFYAFSNLLAAPSLPAQPALLQSPLLSVLLTRLEPQEIQRKKIRKETKEDEEMSEREDKEEDKEELKEDKDKVEKEELDEKEEKLRKEIEAEQMAGVWCLVNWLWPPASPLVRKRLRESGARQVLEALLPSVKSVELGERLRAVLELNWD